MESKEKAKTEKPEARKCPVDLLISELHQLALQTHYSCEDSWYSCPKSENGCYNDAYPDDECNCGADEHNKKVNELYEKILSC